MAGIMHNITNIDALSTRVDITCGRRTDMGHQVCGVPCTAYWLLVCFGAVETAGSVTAQL